MSFEAPFTLEDARRANDEWGANCGPGALAAILRKPLDAVRPLLAGFDEKRYTNPTMMFGALAGSGARLKGNVIGWPNHGLVRIQWGGPWMRPEVPVRARYRFTHWIGVAIESDEHLWIFDINAMAVGGWIPFAQWDGDLVPWIIKHCVPRGDGTWTRTHSIEVPR